jgi:LEA14-like dessication related protein
MDRHALGALLLCIGLLCMSGCTTRLQEPTVTVTDITLEAISLSSMTVLVTVRVDNPNPVGVTIADLSFDLFYEANDGEQYLGHGGQENLTIRAENSTSFGVPVRVDNLQALRAAVVLFREKSLTLVARGAATVDLKIATVRIPFEKRKTLP